ncbi:myo-inositol 2-dehydrogenase [Portibacter lacus]|uniref:Myo-inositol 2-dehydrogenase n=2 Tax=Portibacter lacus TaxID=1099794 RepID=A0AA37SM16_9BACT|nr:myo-inositol 2-dehydrogenase [Portibacter lacus]
MNELKKIKVLVVGVGNMGKSHAISYFNNDGFELVGLVARSDEAKNKLSAELGGVATFSDYKEAIKTTKPDAVSINTYPDTHEEIALFSIENNAHIFLEKPMATTVEGAEKIKKAADQNSKKVVIGYILRHHPSWTKFITLAQKLGKPLVMRMNLNQQSYGDLWNTHKMLMASMSPIVDCGVHYVDIMCQMTKSQPIKVYASGVNLTSEIDPNMYNYGMLQVTFADGSIGWYESGWGPMMSKTAYFVKDVIGPEGSVSIIEPETKSSDIEDHVKTSQLLFHHTDGEKLDEYINTETEPNHQELCDLEQAFFLQAIRENVNLDEHLNDAINSLKIVLAADTSVREGRIVEL